MTVKWCVSKVPQYSSDEIKRRTKLSWLRIRKWPNPYYLGDYLEPHSLVVSVSGYEARGPGSIPGYASTFSVLFSFFSNILMLNYFIY